MLWLIQDGMALTFKGNRFDEFLSTLKEENCEVLIDSLNTILDPPFDFSTLNPEEPTILYCSIDMGKRFHQESKLKDLPSPGVWFDPELLRCSSYFKYIGDYLLNKDYSIWHFSDLNLQLFDSYKERIFIRPERNEKRKLFVGQSFDRNEFKSWYSSNEGHVDPDAMCIVSSGKKISREWRLIINRFGSVVSGSLYKTDGNLTYENGFPLRVENFAEKIASLWSPHPVWCLDVGECDGSLGVVELSTINCSGWYDAEIQPIVKSINDAVTNPDV